jgi:photosystem II stability/assembly factor-like uncharacterized protein
MSNYTTYFSFTGKLKHRVKNFVLILCLLQGLQFLFTNQVASQWIWQNPLPQGNALQGVSFFDESNIFVCGGAGTSMKTTDGGNTWSYDPYGTSPYFYLYQVVAMGQNTAIAAGANSQGPPTVNTGILKTTDGGVTWVTIHSSLTAILYNIAFVDANTGIAVGIGMSGSVILRTTNGGENWTAQTSGTSVPLYGASFIDGNTGTVVGVGGTILKTTNGGENWTSQTSGTTSQFWSVHFTDANTGTAVGAGGTIRRTTNGGNNWISQVSGVTHTLYSVAFTNQNNGIIVGMGNILTTTNGGDTWITNTQITESLFNIDFLDANTGIAVGDIGTIVKTTDGGQNWEYKTGGPAPEYRGAFFTTRSTGVLVGSEGVITRTTNGGQNWVSQESGTTNLLSGIFFTGINTGIAVGALGTIIVTTDGGSTWSPQASGVAVTLSDIFFINASTGTIVGNTGTIIKTTDGGASWFPQTSGLTQSLNDVFFVNANTGIIVGNQGRILRTTNGGNNWTSQTNGSPNLNQVCFTDENNGTAVGNSGRILRTTNGGLSWTAQTSGISLPLNAVYFTDANTGFVAGNAGTIIKTTNGGTNWVVQPSRATTLLIDIFCTDANNAIAIGGGGTILRIESPPSNSNYGSNSQAGDNQYFFANSTPEASGAPSQPEFIWRDTTGSIDLYANGSNQAPGIFTGTNDNGRWDLLTQLGGGNIRFFGSDYTNFYVGTNGIIGFNAFNATASQPPFSGLNQSDITEAVFPLWMDMNVDYAGVSGRRISYKVTASELIVTYTRIPVYSSSSTNDPDRYISFQAIIKFNNGTPAQNSLIFLSYNYDETGPLFVSEYNAGTLSPHLIGLQKNNDIEQFIQYRFRNVLTVPADGPLFGSNLTLATGPDADVLPVELVSFTASVNNRNVQLTWATVSEINNAGFDIEKMPIANGQSAWEKIGFVNGNGTVNEMKNFSYTDNNVQSGKYNYRLKQIDYNGNYEYFNLPNEVTVGVPAKYDLSQNYPNPFNPVTKINFDLPVDSKVTMKMFDIMGREVATLLNEVRQAGYHTVIFDAGNFASGVYFYKIIAGAEKQFMMTKKMMIIK